MFKINWTAVAAIGLLLLALIGAFLLGYRIHVTDDRSREACEKRNGVYFEDHDGNHHCIKKNVLIEIDE